MRLEFAALMGIVLVLATVFRLWFELSDAASELASAKQHVVTCLRLRGRVRLLVSTFRPYVLSLI
jgi:hypothetical protein